MKKTILSLTLLIIFSCTPKKNSSSNKIVILANKSMTGEGSLIDRITSDLDSKEFVVKNSGQVSGVYSELIRLQRANELDQVDIVVGLDESSYQSLRKKKIVSDGVVFDQGPFALIYNGALPLELKGLKLVNKELLLKHFSKKMLLPDPRLSLVGKSWLQMVFLHKIFSLEETKALVKRVYPSWSSMYSAFTKTSGSVAWTYLSSLSYHKCRGEDQFSLIKFDKGFPVHKEYIAKINNSKNQHNEAYNSLKKKILSSKIQQEIPKLNWMYPADLVKTQLPDCFVPFNSVNVLQGKFDSEKEALWLDQWTL